MDERWAMLIPALPLIAGLGVGSRLLGGARWTEGTLSGAVRLALGVSFVGSLVALVGAWVAGPRQARVGTWLSSGDYQVDLALRLDVPGAGFAASALGSTLLVASVSTRYMHREVGYARLYALLAVFGGAVALLALADNLVLAFVGWELAGACSALLIAFYPERGTSADAGLRGLLTNRVGDVAFAVAIGAVVAGTGSPDWAGLTGWSGPWSDAAALALVVAGATKAGLVPATPWLARAIEGPTPTSALFYGAVMVNAGVLLLVRASPLLDAAPVARGLAVSLGLLSFAYGQLAGRAQPDVKSGLVLLALSQTGLAFALVAAGQPALGLGWAVAHGVGRMVQILLAPSFLAVRRLHPAPAVPWVLARRPALQLAAADRFWLEELHAAAVVRPVRAVARLAGQVERGAVERLTGAGVPGLDAAGALAAREERDLEAGEALAARGLFGGVTAAVAGAAHLVEDVVIGGWFGRRLPRAGRRIGARLDAFERVLRDPRVVLAIVVASVGLAGWAA